jgi:hypothetical protein
MVKRKLGHIANALRDLADYIEGLSPDFRGEFFRGPGVDIPISRCLPLPDELRQEAERYESLGPTAEELVAEAKSGEEGQLGHPLPRARVDNLGTQMLVDFFTQVCHLSKTEASVRTTNIGNALFQWDSAVQPDYIDASMPRRAETVRSRMRRRRQR